MCSIPLPIKPIFLLCTAQNLKWLWENFLQGMKNKQKGKTHKRGRLCLSGNICDHTHHVVNVRE